MFTLVLTAVTAILSIYFCWRFWAAFRNLGRWNLAVAAVLVTLTFGRYISSFLHRHGWYDLSDAVRLVGLLWLILLLWFLVIGLALNLWNVLAWLTGHVWPAARAWRLRPRTSFLVTATLVLLMAVWGWFEACQIRVRHVDVIVKHLPAGMETFRIAHLSDLHIGSPRSRQRLLAATALLRQLRPDMIVSTGDMVDRTVQNIDYQAKELRDIQPAFGKYAVLGNHEFYAGVRNSQQFHEAAGFRVLRGERVSPAEGLELVGVDDPAVLRRGGDASAVDEVPLLEFQHQSATVILLKHQPRIADAAVGAFDLQMSGHTHGGQVFPMGLLVRLVYGYWPGLHHLPKGSHLFISRGTGTWGPPLRLASRPEVVLLTLRKASTP